MPRIIDGDNLLGTWPGRRRSDTERRELAREVFRWGVREHRRAVLVFDGPQPAVPPPAHDVHYSGPGRSADAWIMDYLRKQADPRGWTVVTNDRPLADQCRYLGARVERCERLRERLAIRDDGSKPEGPGDVEEWLQIFGNGTENPDDVTSD